MTTSAQPIVLDRLITRIRSGGDPSPDTLALRYETEVFSIDTPGAGEYNAAAALVLWLGATDSDGVVIPAGASPTSIRITGTDGINHPFDRTFSNFTFTHHMTYVAAQFQQGNPHGLSPSGTIEVRLIGLDSVTPPDIT